MKQKNYGLICFSREDSDMLKYYVCAYKNLDVSVEDLIDILNNNSLTKFTNKMIVCEILYSRRSRECNDYFYLLELNINPHLIIWDKSYHIGLKDCYSSE